MKLKDNLYTITAQKSESNTSSFRLKWNRNCFIYTAHFPENPITPGVCLIQTAVELFGTVIGRDFNIHTLKNVKFTAPVNPLEFPEVNFLLEYASVENSWNIKVTVNNKEMVFAKMSLTVI
jgi:3-hydroxyacyl-[acyl-carrier-protein] dehydratase